MRPVLSQAAIADADQGFRQLLEAESPRLAALARRLLGSADEAADAVQGALELAWARRASLGDPASGPAWLRRIVVHRALSHLRRRRFWKALGAVLLVDEEPVAPGPDEAVERRAHLEALAKALDGLSARQATAFSLRYLEGLSLDEVADAMQLERGTARVHLQRAVTALRAKGLLPGPGETT